MPQLPASWQSDQLDLVYISNWSRTTEQIIDVVLSRAKEDVAVGAIAQAAAAHMIEVYRNGGCLPTQRHVRQALIESQKRSGVTLADKELIDAIVTELSDRLNNHLYRHQALAWVVEIAKSSGLKLGLYGRGWQDNEEFAPDRGGFVKPVADPGKPGAIEQNKSANGAIRVFHASETAQRPVRRWILPHPR